MVDIVDSATRSRMMSGIRGKNTIPELVVRRGLHRNGFRYRLHVSSLPGKPDIVLPKYRAVVYVNGCFWHGHGGCLYFKLPSTKIEFWKKKIERNILNDARSIRSLIGTGWRVAIVWECALKGKAVKPLSCLLDDLSEWLLSESSLPAIEFTSAGGPFPVSLG
jgi:DNA mismatch endonuclease, patch repair protein